MRWAVVLLVVLAGSSRADNLPPDRIHTVMRAHTGRLRACYQRELQRNPVRRSGKVVVEIRVATNGSVAAARVKSTTLGSAAIEECLVRVVRTLKFPPAEAETVDYPITFRAGD